MKKRICDLCDESIKEDYIRVKTKRTDPLDTFSYENNCKERFDFCPSCYKRIKKIIKEVKDA